MDHLKAFEPFPLAATSQSLVDRFEQQVRRFGNRLCVKDRRQALTYEELNHRANQVAHAVALRCVRREGAIGLCVPSGALATAAMVGILKTGRPCVFLDPGHPPARLANILEDAQLAGVVVAARDSGTSREPLARLPLIALDGIAPTVSGENPSLAISPDDTACIIYTSGSTGRPKGVVHTHRTLLHESMRRINALQVSCEDHITQFTAGTIQAIGLCLSAVLSGAALHPLSVKAEGVDGLSLWLRQEGITLYHSAAPLFRQFAGTLTGKEVFPALRLIRLASDTVYPADVELYRRRFAPPCRLVNGLASSEAGTTCLYFMNHDTLLTGSAVPVGSALEGIELFVAGEDRADLATSGMGEIAVKSEYLSPGYWNQPALTEAAFLRDPAGSSARIYFTGDLGRLAPEGRLEHLGRTRFRVKIRGNHVETPEVETALRGLDNIKDAVVIPSETAAGDTDLLAYAVACAPPPPSPLVLRQSLRQILPDYMVPKAFVFLEALPMTPNGKIDRLALPAPDAPRASSTTAAAPRTRCEERLAQLWSELLAVKQPDLGDDFFASGGDSLLAMRLLVAVRERFRVEIPMSTLVEEPTIAALARAIEAPGGIVTPRNLLAYKPFGSRPPFFCVHGVELLARHMDPDQPFYALYPHAMDGRRPPLSVEAMAADYVRTLQIRQPAGPYFLGGYSFGGLVAFEMAQQLQRQGHAVALLALLDSGGPVARPSSAEPLVVRLKRYTLELTARLWLAYVRDGRTVPPRWRMSYFLGTSHLVRRAYQAAVFQGRLVLLRARENARDPQRRWGGLARLGLDVRDVPGNHVSMLEEPQVQLTAAMLDRVLREAQEP